MGVILFGATGMVGQGVLRECLRDDGVEAVLAVGRSSTGRTHPKLRELVRKDLFDFGAAGTDLQGYDACFFCLGVSSAGMSEADYTRLTYDLTLGWAQKLARVNPAMTFVYVVLGPLLPLVRAVAPGAVITTEELGRAMIRAARQGAPKRVLEGRDLRALGAP